MRYRAAQAVALAWMLAGAFAAGRAQNPVSSPANAGGRRPMTFSDLMRMKRISDPQISTSGKWVMFSSTEVDLEKNTKVNHLWLVPLPSSVGTKGDPIERAQAMSAPAGAAGSERQLTFWKDGESDGRFSPDGKQVSFIANDTTTGLSQIFLASWDEATGRMGTPVRLTGVSTEADGAVWSPDSQRILFTSRVYPDCSNAESWIDEDACDKKMDEAAAASPVKAQVWNHLLYRHWDHYVGPKRSHVLVVSATDGNAIRDLTPRRDIGDAEAPTFSLGGPIGYAWSPDSKEIAYVANVDLVPAASTNNDVYILRLDSTFGKPLKVSLGLGSDDAPAYSPDGKWLAYRSQARPGYESDRFRLLFLDRESMRSAELLPKFDRWVDEFTWAPNADSVYIASGDAGHTAVMKVPLTGQTAGVPQMISNEHEMSDLQISRDGGLLVASEMSVTMPTELSVTDLTGVVYAQTVQSTPEQQREFDDRQSFSIAHTLARGNEVHPRRQLTHLNDALVNTLDLGRQATFKFAGADGTQVQGFMIRPPHFDPQKKYPVKFLMHGGPEGAWGDAWSYRWNPELMAASGYVVVMVNPRGSTGYGQAFIDGVNGDWGGKAYVDLIKGLDFAEQHYGFIDKMRECALGASFGGFMANWMLTHTDRFACIVTHDGMYNPSSAYGSTEELWFNEWEFRAPGPKGELDAEPAQPWRYQDRPVAQDPFRKWSPMLSIRNAKTPTLVIHSQRDYRLDVSEGFQLFTALQRMNVPSKMLYFPDEGHWVLKPQNAKLWNETVSAWCDQWTKTTPAAGAMRAAEPVRPPVGAELQIPPASPAPAIFADQPVTPEAAPAKTAAALPVTQQAPAQPLLQKSVAPPPIVQPASPAVDTQRTPSQAAPPVTVPAPQVTAPPPAQQKAAVPAPVVVPAPSTNAPAQKPVAPVQPSQSIPIAPQAQQPQPAVQTPAPSAATRPTPETAPAKPVVTPQEASNGSFSLTVSAPATAVHLGADVRVVITLKNVSDHPIRFAHRPGVENGEYSFLFVVRDASGRLMAEDISPLQGAQENTVDTIQPGGSSVQAAHINKLVKFTQPGMYSIRVFRKDTANNTVVQSNELMLNVLAAVRGR